MPYSVKSKVAVSMRFTSRTHHLAMQFCRLIDGLSVLACFAVLWQVSVPAQPAFNTATTARAQRNALNSVGAQVRWLQNNTRTASNFREQGYGSMWRSFQELRREHVALTQTLTPQQSANGANDLAELNTGLDILQEAFDNYREEVAAGHSADLALANLSRILRQGSTLWLEKLNKTSSRLKIGWG